MAHILFLFVLPSVNTNKYNIRYSMEVTLSNRYHSQELSSLVVQLNSQHQMERKMRITKIQIDRKVHQSCVQISKSTTEGRPLFNNKTKQGNLFVPNPPQIPYLFIPKYKNDNFIMPDRVFQKGKAGKRFYIKMKDTSIGSFKDAEGGGMEQYIKRRQKDKVICSRKLEQLNRILDENDGRVRAKKFSHEINNRKIFNPTTTHSQIFSNVSPMLQPKDLEAIQMKKLNLAKTFGPNLWRPVSRGNSMNRTMNCSFSKTTEVGSHFSNR